MPNSELNWSRKLCGSVALMIRRPGEQLQGNREAQAMLIHQLDFNVGSIANVDTIGSEN